MGCKEQIRKRYEGGAGSVYHDIKRGIPPQAYPWVAQCRAEKIAPYVAERDVVLEYGVGTGWNLADLRCRRKLGYDATESLQSILSEQGIEFVADLATLQDASVDVVICHHVLEHLADPFDALTEMRRLLRSGGTLFMVVPYEKERRCRSYNPSDPNHHLFSWNVQTLCNLTADAGFAIQRSRIAGYGYDRFASVQAVRLRLGEGGFRLIRRIGQILFPLKEIRILATKA
ncbi:MAG: methyltransferase domain-containing protein [Sedimentisphaerales bacterium]|nr:methyltransferase domain-containing protein [Sedimentisphaerales bacterium]